MNSSNENRLLPDSESNSMIFGDPNFGKIIRYLVGNNQRYRENIIIPPLFGPVQIKTKEEKMVEAVFESCPFKSAMSCVVGKVMLALV